MAVLKRIIKKINELDKKKKVYFLGVILIVFVMLWAFITAGVITSKFNRNLLKNNINNQKVDAIGIIITETKEGKKYFEIYGESGSYSNDHKIATLHNVVGNFYENNDVAMSFQSTKGSYSEDEGSITLYDNTYIVLKDSTSLQADKLVWLGSGKDIIAEGNVKIRKNNEMISLADKCIINANYEKFKIIGKTQTKIYGK